MIAYKMSTIQDADSILFLNVNLLVAVETPDSLLAENEFSRMLVANQQIHNAPA